MIAAAPSTPRTERGRIFYKSRKHSLHYPMKPYARAQLVPLDEMKDRRRVLTDKQKEQIKEIYAKGDIGTRPLAKMFGCSRSLVMLIVNPKRAKAVQERFKAHWRDYAERYGNAAHAAAIRKTRNYKYALYKAQQAGMASEGMQE